MKNLLVLMLVLGMATVANAAIMLSVNGDTGVDYIEIPICTNVLIDVYDDTGGLSYGAWLGIDNVDGGEWTGEYVIYGEAGPDASVRREDLAWWELSAKSFDPQDPVQPGKHFDVEYHCLGPWCKYVTIELWNFDYDTLLDTITIHQIPEPATMALLGLGGLALLRRRK